MVDGDHRTHCIKRGDKLIAGVRYRLTVKMNTDNMSSDRDPAMWLRYDDNVKVLDDIRPFSDIDGVVTFEFIPTKSIDNAYIIFAANYGTYDDTKKDDYYTIDDVTLKQVEDEILVVVDDVEAGDLYENPLSFVRTETISRNDFIFVESWSENIENKDFVYPYGNTQYKNRDLEGLPTLKKGDFEGADTYSLFGNWQNPDDLVGKGYKWSELSRDEKAILLNDPKHKLEIINGKTYQKRYRFRVVKGLANFTGEIDKAIEYNDRQLNYYVSPSNAYWIQTKGKLTSIEKDLDNTDGIHNGRRFLRYKHGAGCTAENTQIGAFGIENPDEVGCGYAIPVALIQRRNKGAFDIVYNQVGSAKATDTINSLEDCFNSDKIEGGDIASGISGRFDKMYYDEVNKNDVTDYRNLITDETFDEILRNKLIENVASDFRGKEYQFTTKWFSLGDRSINGGIKVFIITIIQMVSILYQ